MRRVVLVAGALALAGCGEGGEGTSISITGNAEDGNLHGATVDGASGKVKVDLPFFEGSFSLPKMQLDANSFDLNDVRLYPGSTIKGINVDAGGKGEDGLVKISFDSPASAASVRDYLQPRLTGAGYTLQVDRTGLRGTTDEDKPFALSLRDAGAGRSTGTITIG